jgi:two-component system, cell cycle response regulator
MVEPVAEWDDETSVTMQADLALPTRSERRDRAYLIVLAGNSVGQMFKIPGGQAVIGRGRTAEVRLFDEGVSREHARIRAEGNRLLVEDLGSRNGTFCNGKKVDVPVPLADGDKIQVGRTTILKFTYHDALDESFHEQMYESALRDALTKAYNKRYFADRLDGEFRFARRHETSVALLMLDIDHFKKINDTYGHPAGDTVLIAVADVLTRSVRNEDVVARYGGEEFAVISRAINLEGARVLAERLRRMVEALQVDVGAAVPLRVTCSIGAAAFPESPNVQNGVELVEVADSALYRAKNSGRNRVCL